MVLLTVVNTCDVLSHSVDNFVAWSVTIYDGGVGLLIDIAQHGGQACG